MRSFWQQNEAGALPEQMEFVYNCDEGYLPHTAASICSLFANNRGAARIRVHILGNGIGAESCERLSALAKSFSGDGFRAIAVHDLGNFEGTVRALAGGAADAGKFTITALARIFAADLLPEDVVRVIYLDCDTAVLGDFRALWETELGGRAAALVAEPTIYPEVRVYTGLSPDAPYYNAGLILMDLERWRAEKIKEACMAFYREQGGSLPFSDQDLLNHALRGKALTLPQRWNFLTNYHYQSYRSLLRQAPWYAAVSGKEAYEAAKKAPAMVHFAGDERPWIAGNFNPYRREYRRYLDLTPWRGAKPVQGKRLYMLCYHLMNLATAVCPPVRRALSAYFYRSYMKKRGKTS